MKSYTGITGKYLRVQKKRSVLTVMGIILSVALVTGIGTIFLSMYEENMRSTIRDYGDWYAAFTAVPGGKATEVMQNVQVEKAGVCADAGFAAFSENEKNGLDTPYKYLDIKAMDANAMTMLPGYTLLDGRLPQAPGEIAVDYWVLKHLPEGTAIGGAVTLGIGTRALPDGTPAIDTHTSDPGETFTKTGEANYRIVGTLKPRFISTMNFAHAVTWLDAGSLPDTGTYAVYVKTKSVGGIQDRARGIAADAGLNAKAGGKNAILYNDRVLRLYAQGLSAAFNSSFIFVLLVITGLVVVSTIAVIYNAFNISVVERVSQFGLLRCVGATPAQIRGIVFREALILGSIGIPAGIACGSGAMAVVFAVINAIAPDMLMGGLKFVTSPWLILASAVTGAVTIYLSALLPARKAAKISPMEAVRGTGVLKKEKYRKSDRHRVVLRLLGAEGWMAWKNLGRNRRRFYITVLSMVISIMLFIVFSSLVEFAYKSGAVDTSEMPAYTIWPKRSNDKLNASPGFIAGLQGSEGVDYVLAYADTYAEIKLPAGKVDARAASLIASAKDVDAQGNVTLYNSDLIGYSDGSVGTLKRALGLAGLDEEAFRGGEGVILVNAGQLPDREHSRTVLTDVTTLRPGDPLTVNIKDLGDESATGQIRTTKVLAVADKGMPGFSSNQNGGVYLIVSEKLLRELAPGQAFPKALMVMMKPGSSQEGVKERIDEFIEQNPIYNLTDMQEVAEQFRQVWTVMGIFLYGFVVVISLIGCLNIVNTVSTNIILRTRELSVLRAIGMAEAGIRRMVAMESVLHGAAAALVGSVAGTALSWLVYNSLISVREFAWELPWQQILVAVAAAAFVAVVSGWLPLKRINRGVIMEGIRGEE